MARKASQLVLPSPNGRRGNSCTRVGTLAGSNRSESPEHLGSFVGEACPCVRVSRPVIRNLVLSQAPHSAEFSYLADSFNRVLRLVQTSHDFLQHHKNYTMGYTGSIAVDDKDTDWHVTKIEDVDHLKLCELFLFCVHE